MSFEQTFDNLTGFHTHENTQIADFAKKLSRYATALRAGEISADEYRRLLGDIDSLQHMARTADEQSQIVQVHQLASALLFLL